MSAPGKDPAGNILQQLNIREPSQQTRPPRIDEPATERPQETPPPVYTPKDDPFEREKDKRYKVNLFEMLKAKTAIDPEEASTISDHAVNYLLFDNYFDYLCSGRLKTYGVPQLDGQEQAMYFCFYRFSYGYGYSACPMSDATLMGRLDWVRKHVKRVLGTLLEKKVIVKEVEFPMFRHRRPQVYRVYLPREIVQNALQEIRDAQGRYPEDIPPEIRTWIREFTA
jgi:hypothetical protein